MSHYSIISRIDHSILFEDDFASFNDCLEQAAQDQVNLAHADLRNRNLSNICLDDARLTGADFTGSNLAGANLSESDLSYALLKNTDIYNVCFAYANLNLCNFEGAAFGGTDITGSNLDHSRFSTLSCFSLDFSAAEKMNQCRFSNDQGQSLTMSRPPIVIRGLGRHQIVLAETAWAMGMDIRPYPEQFHPIAFLGEQIKVLG